MIPMHASKPGLIARAILMVALCALVSCAGRSGGASGSSASPGGPSGSPAQAVTGASSRGPTEPEVLSGASLVRGPAPSILGDLAPAEAAGRTLVVFFSSGQAGTRVAEDLAALFSADIERIREVKRRGPGFFGYMGGGMDASFRASTRIWPTVLDPADYDRVFVVTPIWAWNLCPPVRTWLRAHAGDLPPAAFATVSGDTEPGKVAMAMAKAGGREPFAVAGFAERDFYPENRASYLEKIGALRDAAARP